MYLTEDDCRLADLVGQVSEKTDLADYPQASDVEQNVLIYDSARLRAKLDRPGDVRRMANLLQVSSAFGRAMETVDRRAMSAALFGALRAMRDAGAAPSMIANAIAACAEGYSFPTNLNLDQPVDGLAPPTQAEILAQAVAQDWSQQRLETELGGWSARRQSQPQSTGETGSLSQRTGA
jgi:hypothetical protein